MPATPDTRLGKVKLFESHAVRWDADAMTNGLAVEEVAEFGAFTDEARAAYNEYRAAQAAADAASKAFEEAVARMEARGAQLLRKTDAKATPKPKTHVTMRGRRMAA